MVAVCSATSAAAQELGTKDPGLFNLKGQIYFLPKGTDHLPPDIEEQKVEGVIYTEKLDVPPRAFSKGFPGVTSRFEWFGIIYTGKFQVAAAGNYQFRSHSDDGIVLWIDGTKILQRDSIHPPQSAHGSANLAAGLHDIRVWYFQGPAYEIALQLFVTPPGGGEKIFSVKEFSGDLDKALTDLGGEATEDGIRIRLDATLLFDYDQAVVKPTARAELKKLATVLASYPNAHVTINGHTSSEGEDAYNLRLSEQRANAVEAALAMLVPDTVSMKAVGHGEGQPIADNKTDQTRARNRRVEVFVKP